MNTIKKTMLIASILLFATVAKSQTYYYNETKTFQEEGYIYQADFSGHVEALLRSANTRSANIDMTNTSGRVTLYNKNNRYTYQRRDTYKDGTPIDKDAWEATYEDTPRSIENNVRTIISNILSPSEKERMGERGLYVAIYFNPDTGKAIEVLFEFDSDNPFATLPVSVYRKIELEILNQITVTPTAYGKRLSVFGWGTYIALNGRFF
jgi:hypothetical protein